MLESEMLKSGRVPAYPKVWALDHPQAAGLLKGTVFITEKIDGSQISWGVDAERNLFIRSKGQQINLDAPEKLFETAVDRITKVAHLLRRGYVYRGEYLRVPKHNTFAYRRVPEGNIMLFDIETLHQRFMYHTGVAAEAYRIGFEPILLHDVLQNPTREQLDLLASIGLKQESQLGVREDHTTENRREGLVFKNYNQFGVDGRVLMVKYVADAFKEAHDKNWRKRNPGQKDLVTALTESVATPARFEKAVQHLRDNGQLSNSEKDIGLLMSAIGADIEEEMAEQLKTELWDWAWPQIQRGALRGVPNWYKNRLQTESDQNV